MSMGRIYAGRAFHDMVENAFLTNLVGATGFRQRGWRLAGGGRTRVDLAVVSDDDAVLTIIEIKGTDWDKILPGRIKRNLRLHLRQIQTHIETSIDELEMGLWESVVAALLYPARPTNPESLATIEGAAAAQEIMVAWYEDVANVWRSNGKTPKSVRNV